jgi:3-phosphoshikimate 1-carboxyvinyltransferase
LSEIEVDIPPASSHIKNALLFSGLFADGPTYVREPEVTRDHAVRLLGALDVPVSTAGSVVELDPSAWSGEIPGFSHDVPGDGSAAALLLGAASLVPDSRVCVRGVGLNPTRAGWIDGLRSLGSAVDSELHEVVQGEPIGTVCASSAPLRAIHLEGEVLLRASGELAVLAALAAVAQGETEIVMRRDAQLRAGVTFEVLAELLRGFGVDAEAGADRLRVAGRADGAPRAGDVDAADSPHLADAAMLLGLVADGPTRIRRVDGWAAACPRIVGTLRALGADLRVEERNE